MKLSKFLHPFMFSLYPVLYIYMLNIREVTFLDIVPALLSMIGLSTLVLLLSCLIYRSLAKAGIFASLSIMLFFSYGHVYGLLSNLPLGRHRYLLFVFLLILIIGFFSIRKLKSGARIITSLLNAISLALLIIAVIRLYPYAIKTLTAEETHDDYFLDEMVAGIEAERDSLPDVYYLISDAYMSSAGLKLLGFENAKFLAGLSDRGFYVAEDSRCNYIITPQSLASSLNMEYLDMAKRKADFSNDMRMLNGMIQENRIYAIMKALGYEVYHFGTYWGPTAKSSAADKSIRPFRGLNSFSITVLRQSMLNAVYERAIHHLYRRATVEIFENLQEIAGVPGPTFVFAHIMCPHKPFVFERNGSDLALEQALSESDEAVITNYLGQIEHINRELLAVVDQILAIADNDPVIVIQADHGFPYYRGEDRALYAELKTRILNAFHLPGAAEKSLYSTITPVNSFRVILDEVYGMNIDPLEDAVYLSEYDAPWAFPRFDPGR